MNRRARQMPTFGPLSKNSETLPHTISNGHTFAAPDRLCNATSYEPLVLGQRWSAPSRQGSEDFRRYSSKGTG